MAGVWVVLASTAVGLTTSNWTQRSEEGFAKGEMKSVVVSNLGDLKLAREVKTIVEDDARVNVVYAVRTLADGAIVFGTGPDGRVMVNREGKTAELYKAGAGALVSALAIEPAGTVLAGISGEVGKLVRIEPGTGKMAELYASKEAQLIWAILPMGDGSILLGTGPAGQVIEVAAGKEGKEPRVVLASTQKNILCLLAGDKADEVLLGSDPDGLVIRLNRKTGEWFVVYDADEPEVVALARDAAGNLFAATSAVTEEPGEAEGEAANQGRVQVGKEIPLMREPAPAPQPPQLPDPTPGEPEPIPKEPPKHMSIIEAKPPKVPTTSQPSMQAPPSSRKEKEPMAGPAGESAVYRIDRHGFVAEVFRKAVTVHSMVYSGGTLLIGTGPAGQVYEVQPATEEHYVLAQVNSRQVSALGVDEKGQILLGLSNPGGIGRMGSGFAEKGSYISEVLDATQTAQFGKMQLQGTLPAGTAVTVSTRSGNVKNPELGGWSNWSAEKPAAEFIPVAAPSARFLQYRLSLSSGNPAKSPVVEEVKVSYLLPNIAPKISSVQVQPDEAADDASPAACTIAWEASDANGDLMTYSLYYRLGTRGEWILLKDKVKEKSYLWNTRQLADGRYQVRVVASDALSNPIGEGLTTSRFSETVMVDNTPPAIGDIKTEQTEDGVRVSLRAVDRTSTVAGVQYAVDSRADWQAAASSDMLYDSPEETVSFVVPGLAVGQHQLALRAKDSQGNTAYETVLVTVVEKVRK